MSRQPKTKLTAEQRAELVADIGNALKQINWQGEAERKYGSGWLAPETVATGTLDYLVLNDPAAEPDPARDLSAALTDAMASQYDSGDVISGAVLVYEYIDKTGTLRLAWEETKRLTPWHASGMLRRALRYYERRTR